MKDIEQRAEDYENLANRLHNAIRSIKHEYIICAANHHKDGLKHQHQPKNIESGFIVCGRRHHNCFITVTIIKKEDIKKVDFGEVIQGFLTSKDRFVDRKEAAKIALESNQITKEKEILFSEDLY